MSTILNQTEVAAIFKVSPATFRMWLKGRPDLVPPCFNIGTADKPILRFIKEDVMNHIDKLSTENRHTIHATKPSALGDIEDVIVDI